MWDVTRNCERENIETPEPGARAGVRLDTAGRKTTPTRLNISVAGKKRATSTQAFGCSKRLEAVGDKRLLEWAQLSACLIEYVCVVNIP